MTQLQLIPIQLLLILVQRNNRQLPLRRLPLLLLTRIRTKISFAKNKWIEAVSEQGMAFICCSKSNVNVVLWIYCILMDS